jgi:hypothetical protein
MKLESIKSYKKDFEPFKGYPNIQKSKLKQIKVSDELPEWDLSFLYKSWKEDKIFKDLKSGLSSSKKV